MSYAAAASKGPEQSAEEKRAPAPPIIEHAESASTSSLIDVDTDSVHTVPSDFSSNPIQTETQRDRIEREMEDEEVRAKAEAARAKKASKKGINKLHANSDNPVFVANALAVVGLSGALGFGAYQKHVRGELTWKLVGAWVGVVGLFGVGDYYLSQYLFKNKYPPKK